MHRPGQLGGGCPVRMQLEVVRCRGVRDAEGGQEWPEHGFGPGVVDVQDGRYGGGVRAEAGFLGPRDGGGCRLGTGRPRGRVETVEGFALALLAGGFVVPVDLICR